MADVEDILARMRQNPQNMRFVDLCKVCDFYFGPPRQTGTSHRVYRMPWQVIAAIERLKRERAEEA